MKHLGDISKIDGGAVEPVDVVIGGSPCQDVSVAGKRKGMKHEERGDEETTRSGLYIAQIRVIREMREADAKRGRTGQFLRPRFMVWENVPGALSSNGGEDFRAVLEEAARVKEAGVVIPRPPDGKWPNAGCVMGDGWSIAWRIHDAQFWGVPQRRRRIALVADFGGGAAPEILFERESLSWDPTEGGEAREGTSGGAAGGFNPAVARSLTARHDGSPCVDRGSNLVVRSAGFCQGASLTARSIGYHEEISPTIKAASSGTAQIPAVISLRDQHAVFDARGNGSGELSPTLTGGHQSSITDYTAIVIDRSAYNCGEGSAHGISIDAESDTAYTLTGRHPGAICMATGQGNAEITEDFSPTLNCNHEQPIVADPYFAVRRLTPLEYERLQGDPDGWTDIPGNGNPSPEEIAFWREAFRTWEQINRPPKHGHVKGRSDAAIRKWLKNPASDSARYKALGNSIALPFWKWLCKRICALYARDATMGSLFDGIGGFPLIWEQINGCGSCRWASEIEPFPIAVTRYHFGRN